MGERAHAIGKLVDVPILLLLLGDREPGRDERLDVPDDGVLADLEALGELEGGMAVLAVVEESQDAPLA